MKSKYLFLAFAASAALVGCQNEEVLAPNEADANGKAIDAGEIRFAVSKDDAATRAVWNQEGNNYDFYWEGKEQIGVAYIGDAGNEMQSQGVTNYQFVTDSLKLTSFKIKEGNTTTWSGYYGLDENGIPMNVDGLYVEYSSEEVGKSKNAKFRTYNDYIFEGYYAVYYPFDDAYKKKGYIPVKSPESITVELDENGGLADNLSVVAEHTFSFSKPQPFKAGDNVAEFKLQQLSGLLKLNLRNRTKSSIDATKGLQKVLVVPSQEFTVSGKLNSVDATPSENVISDAKTASAMEVKFSAEPAEEVVALDAEETFTAGNLTIGVYTENPDNTVPVYIPMLPKSGFTGMDVYLINKEGAAIKVKKTANFDITSASVQPVGIDITSDKFDTWIAYDEKSFKTVAASAPAGSVIELLKPITLKSTVAVSNEVTIQGKAITLDGGASLTFSTAGTVVKSEIIANGGSLTPTNATFGKLTVNANKSLELKENGNFDEIVNNGNLTLGGVVSIDNPTPIEMSVNVVKATNNGKLAIKNKAAINPTGSAMKNQGEVYQYVGSVIGAKSLENAEAATYTCEVVNRLKFKEAVTRKATKIVLADNKEYFEIPATGAENITIQFDAEAQLKNEKTTNGVTTYVTGVVKEIISNVGYSGGFGARINQNLTVKENIIVKEGNKLKVLKNRTVNVGKKVILEENAEFEREQGGADGIEAKVNCSGIETGQGAKWTGGQPNY